MIRKESLYETSNVENTQLGYFDLLAQRSCSLITAGKCTGQAVLQLFTAVRRHPLVQA